MRERAPLCNRLPNKKCKKMMGVRKSPFCRHCSNNQFATKNCKIVAKIIVWKFNEEEDIILSQSISLQGVY